MKGTDETAAEYLVRRFANARWDPTVKDVLFDELELAFVLRGGRTTPSRTLARVPGGHVTYQTTPLRSGRPDLRKDVQRAPLGVRTVGRRQGRHIVDLAREAMVVRKALRMRKSEAKSVELQHAHGPGNVVFITLQSERVTEVMTGFGQRGVRAEAVAQQAVKEAQQYLAAGAAAGPYLADQLLLPWALARSGRFSMMPPTDHTTTNRAVIQEFLDVRIEITECPDGTYLCVVEEH